MADSKKKVNFKMLEVLEDHQKCVFCKTSEQNKLKLGPVYMYNSLITHYYCLLLSSNMLQNGESDSDGILGFLPSDIEKEVRRGKRLRCTYCKKTGATLGCDIVTCKNVFHLPCGVKNNALNQFFDTFRSYCHHHRPIQKIPLDLIQEAAKEGVTNCIICYESIDPSSLYDTLWAPCCKKSAWFHRDCVQKLASSAGYFFKCPLCNNKDKFYSSMRNFGIYIPEQDASWESVPNAFGDLYYRHDSCDATKCLCPQGRKCNTSGTRWELVLCRLCGSQGMHINCGQLARVEPVWECNECKGTLHVGKESPEFKKNKKIVKHFRRQMHAAKHSSISANRVDDISDEEKTPSINRRKRRAIRRVRNILDISSPSTSTTNTTDEITITDSPKPEKNVLSTPIVIEDNDHDDGLMVIENPISTKEKRLTSSVPNNNSCVNSSGLPALQGPFQPVVEDYQPSPTLFPQTLFGSTYQLEVAEIKPDHPSDTTINRSTPQRTFTYTMSNQPQRILSHCITYNPAAIISNIHHIKRLGYNSYRLNPKVVISPLRFSRNDEGLTKILISPSARNNWKKNYAQKSCKKPTTKLKLNLNSKVKIKKENIKIKKNKKNGQLKVKMFQPRKQVKTTKETTVTPNLKTVDTYLKGLRPVDNLHSIANSKKSIVVPNFKTLDKYFPILKPADNSQNEESSSCLSRQNDNMNNEGKNIQPRSENLCNFIDKENSESKETPRRVTIKQNLIEKYLSIFQKGSKSSDSKFLKQSENINSVLRSKLKKIVQKLKIKKRKRIANAEKFVENKLNVKKQASVKKNWQPRIKFEPVNRLKFNC